MSEPRLTPTPHGPYDPPLRPNDPAPNSLFVKVGPERCRCEICGTEVYNSTEARDGHLNAVDHPILSEQA